MLYRKLSKIHTVEQKSSQLHVDFLLAVPQYKVLDFPDGNMMETPDSYKTK